VKPIRSWKRSVSLAALVAVACSTLQAATPGLDRTATLQMHKPRAALGQSGVDSLFLRQMQLAGGGVRTPLRRDSAEVLQEQRNEPRLELGSLIAGALGVMVCVARRRRAD